MNERICGARNDGGRLGHSALCVVRLAKAGGECCFILTSTASRAKTRFLNQIGIRNTPHRSWRLLREAG
jgi:hypothetical protein